MVGSERLAAQLAHLAQQAGAASASVYLPTPWNPSAPAVLVQAGEAPPLPELATAEAAEAFSAEILETGQWNGQAVSADGLVASKSGDGVLIAAPLLASLWAGVSAAAATRAACAAAASTSGAWRRRPAGSGCGCRPPLVRPPGRRRPSPSRTRWPRPSSGSTRCSPIR
ncbi:MAG: hypothetical protein R2708_09550 [Vicinamibacterales bacterium]